MRKVIVLIIGIIFAMFSFLLIRREVWHSGYKNGLNTGKIMCQDILNRCDNYCREAVKQGVYK